MLVKGSNIINGNRDAVLLIQLGDIGDVVLTLPTIESLRENFPASKLIVCVKEKARDLIEDSPQADGVISVNKQKRTPRDEIQYNRDFFEQLRHHHFNLVIDLRTGTRGAILSFLSGSRTRIGRFAYDGTLWRNRMFTHLVRPLNESTQYAADHNLNIISPFNLEIQRRRPAIEVATKRKKEAREIFATEGIPLDRPIVAIHPFSLWKYKEWGIDQCAPLIDHLREFYKFSVIVTGAHEEHDRAQEMVNRCRNKAYNLAGKTSIGALTSVLQHCRFFVGVDTAALHIAAAVGVPTVGIFGPSSPVSWAPRGPQHTVVSKSWGCVPCRRKGCMDTEISRCLKDLSLEEVRDRVDRRLRELRLVDSPVEVRPVAALAPRPAKRIPPKMSIVIVSYNTVDMLFRCLRSIHTQNGVTHEVIVVDNASQDGSIEMIRRSFPWVRLIRNRRNLGFARANNQALPYCSGEYIYFLNPDTEVHAGGLQHMIEYMDLHPDVGLAGTHILNPDNSPQPSVETRYPGERYARRELQGLKGDIAWVLGATMVARRSVIREVGGFDDRFFLYGEDLDLCLSIRRNGWRIGYIPEAVVVHWGGQSERGSLMAEVWEKKISAEMIFYRKHYSLQTIQSIKRANVLQAYWKIGMLRLSSSFWEDQESVRNKIRKYRLAIKTFR
jgi:predicted lipopolysaccharide heptosyltransferase III